MTSIFLPRILFQNGCLSWKWFYCDSPPVASAVNVDQTVWVDTLITADSKIGIIKKNENLQASYASAYILMIYFF